MSHKKRITKTNVSIENALKQISFPVSNKNGAKVYLDISKTSHSGSKHIAKQYHGLKKKDIGLIPGIISNPTYVCKDKTHKEKKNYYGRKTGGKKIQFIKIVTKVIDQKTEKIVTVFTTNKIKN